MKACTNKLTHNHSKDQEQRRKSGRRFLFQKTLDERRKREILEISTIPLRVICKLELLRCSGHYAKPKTTRNQYPQKLTGYLYCV